MVFMTLVLVYKVTNEKKFFSFRASLRQVYLNSCINKSQRTGFIECWDLMMSDTLLLLVFHCVLLESK